jgi:hypothetical protein
MTERAADAGDAEGRAADATPLIMIIRHGEKPHSGKPHGVDPDGDHDHNSLTSSASR